jgi:2-polyprenyl-6-hydroxyphenyl methylase/3-demethylubiquinone-9 3-methyltransferase
VAERVPGGAPPGIHDPALFVRPARLVALCARHGVTLRTRGVRPAVGAMLRWLVTRRGEVPIVPTRPTAVLYQGVGTRQRDR